MRKIMIIFSFLVISVIIGCSTGKEHFNSENISMTLIGTEFTNEYRSYTIEVSNKTGFELNYLSCNLGYPIKTSNGSEGNPFVILGEPDKPLSQIHLKPGKSITYSVFAPIKEVFSNTNKLDFDKPSIELKGYYSLGKEVVPFGISGSLSTFVNK